MTADRPWSDSGHDIRADLERARELAMEPPHYEPDYWPCPWCRPLVQWRADSLMWHVKEVHPDEWAEVLASFDAVARGIRAVTVHLEEERHDARG